MAKDSRPSSRRNRRVALVMLFMLALVAAGVASASQWILRADQARLLQEMEQNMSSQASNKVALLTVWAGTVKGQMESFTSLDLLRLFASEVDRSGVVASKLLELSQRETSQFEVPPSGTENYEGERQSEPQDLVAPRLPMMRRQLVELVEKNNLWGACLLDRRLEVYLAPGTAPQFNEAQRAFLTQVLETGRPVFLPVRRRDSELAMDMAFPIFAPLYVDPSGQKVVSLLVVTYNVLPVARAIIRPGNGSQFSTGIFQVVWRDLQSINPAEHSGVVDLPGWALEGGRLPLARREMPGAGGKSKDIYVLGKPVPGLPWLVAQGRDVVAAEAQYADFRERVIWGAALVTALAGILLVALWWWLVGRRERAVAEQMRQLYQVVNQQKQIMDGVNSALSAGIVLNSLNGVVHYANQSYARMVGVGIEQLRGLPHAQLPPDLARSMMTHTLAVQKSEGLLNFTESLPLEGGVRHFLTACSPFRDESGQTSGVVSVYSDITDLITAQRRAQYMITQTVAVFVRAIEAVDPYLCGQSTFTAQLSVTLAYCMGLSDSGILATLRTAASLSQVGMIQLPRRLLSKTSALNAEERTLLERHVQYAQRALEGIDFGLPVLEAISQMYERLDGSGYPAKLEGEQICPNARILGVANTFCALMRPRSYRVAMDVPKALGILSETPYKYDPQVVQTLQAFLQADQGKTFLHTLCGERSAPTA